jgi:DNA-directed RNA polymerase subunit F
MDQTKPDIVEEKEVPMFEVKNEMAKIRKRDEEPNFRVQKVEEYVNAFVKLSHKEGTELVEKLRKLNVPRMGDKHIYKIVDILPTTVDDLKMILQGYNITINNDNQKKIVAVVVEFVKK